MAHTSYVELIQLFETFTRVCGLGGKASLCGPGDATLSLTLDKEADEEESVEEEAEPDIFKMEENGSPEVKVIAPGVKPPDRVLHPNLGMGDLPKNTERNGITFWEYNFWRCGEGNIQRDKYQVH